MLHLSRLNRTALLQYAVLALSLLALIALMPMASRADLAPIWTAHTDLAEYGANRPADPWVTGDRIILFSGNGVLALDRKTGVKCWSRDGAAPSHGMENNVMVGVSSAAGRDEAILMHMTTTWEEDYTNVEMPRQLPVVTWSLDGVDAQSGTLHWSSLLPEGFNPSYFGEVRVFGRVVVAQSFGSGGDLLYFDALNGHRLKPRNPADRSVIASGAKAMLAMQRAGDPHSAVGRLWVNFATRLFTATPPAVTPPVTEPAPGEVVDSNAHYTIRLNTTDDGEPGHSIWPSYWVCTNRSGHPLWTSPARQLGLKDDVGLRDTPYSPGSLDLCPTSDILLGTTYSGIQRYDIATRKMLWKRSLAQFAPRHLAHLTWLGRDCLLSAAAGDGKQPELIYLDTASGKMTPLGSIPVSAERMYLVGGDILAVHWGYTVATGKWADFSLLPLSRLVRKSGAIRPAPVSAAVSRHVPAACGNAWQR
jgi:hypothetical protein